jgi:hypothetical protein
MLLTLCSTATPAPRVESVIGGLSFGTRASSKPFKIEVDPEKRNILAIPQPPKKKNRNLN